MLTNKYCKTGVRERTSLRSRFAKACMLELRLMRTVLLMLVTFDENSFTDAACTLKLWVINPSYLTLS